MWQKWNLKPFWPSMASLTESFSPSKHTPLYEKEQKEKGIMQWRLLILRFWFSHLLLTVVQIRPKLKFCKIFLCKYHTLSVKNWCICFCVQIAPWWKYYQFPIFMKNYKCVLLQDLYYHGLIWKIICGSCRLLFVLLIVKNKICKTDLSSCCLWVIEAILEIPFTIPPHPLIFV